MSIYKEAQSIVREFYAYKEFVLTKDEVSIITARRITGSYFYPFPAYEQTQSGIYPRALYESIKQLYYHKEYILEYSSSNLYSGVINDSPIANNSSGSSYKPWSSVVGIYSPYYNFCSNHRYMYKNLGDSSVVISIPQKYIGLRIKPGTVHIEDTSEGITLVDDGVGNLYDYTESSSFAINKSAYHRGNVFYEHGNIVITSLTSSYQSFGTGSNDSIIKFNSTEKVHELETICIVNEGEFNLTLNPSARVSRSLMISELLPYITGSDFSTYPTTIGLYDKSGSLLMVGKLAQPIRNEPDLSLTFVLRYYW